MSLGGGGGGSGINQPDPSYVDPVTGRTFMSSAELNTAIDARQATELVTSNAAKAERTAKELEARNTFTTRSADAQTQATGNVNDYFTQQGVNPAGYANDINAAIQTSANRIPDLSPNPQGSFSDNLGQTIMNSLISGKRTQASDALSGIFGPTYLEDNYNSSWLNPAVDTALGSQFDPLQAQLINARNRGTLRDDGYDAALRSLTDAQVGARSTVSRLGENILAGERSQLGDIISGAQNKAGSLNLNTYAGFDPQRYRGIAEEEIARDRGNFQGNLQNAIGSTAFSSINDLLNAGGVVQGAHDPSATNPAMGGGAGGGGVGDINPSYIAQQILSRQRRGLGSSGAF